MPPAPQRAWRAACPNCGAPVDFRSAASASAVCSFCRSTLVRDGEALRRIGTSAELFDDHTPLQLGAAGRFQGEGFVLVGRLQFGTDGGPWNEWHALFDNGRAGWLSEDNGAYVFAFDATLPTDAPPLENMRPGARCAVDGRVWTVASTVSAWLIAAEGELPRTPPPADRSFTVVDLRNAADEVGTLDAMDMAAPGGSIGWSVGKAVGLRELQLSGLREIDEKTLAGRSLACPSCGAPLALTLNSTQSVVCGQCKAVVDLSDRSRGIGTDLAFYAQDHALEPQIPLGRTGLFNFGGDAPLPWQAVGYVERCELDGGAEGAQEFWREYLLFNRTEGFAFLIDTASGWSWARPLTGTPEAGAGGVRWRGHEYAKAWEYDSQVTYVLGEFYWRVERLQRCHHVDYVGRDAVRGRLLNFERTADEVTWSGGAALSADAVANAFELPAETHAALRRASFDTGTGMGIDGDTGSGPPDLGRVLHKWPLMLFLLLLFIVALNTCSRDECGDEKRAFGAESPEYRACRARAGSGVGGSHGSGGAWGGYSSGGGGHK